MFSTVALPFGARLTPSILSRAGPSLASAVKAPTSGVTAKPCLSSFGSHLLRASSSKTGASSFATNQSVRCFSRGSGSTTTLRCTASPAHTVQTTKRAVEAQSSPLLAGFRQFPAGLGVVLAGVTSIGFVGVFGEDEGLSKLVSSVRAEMEARASEYSFLGAEENDGDNQQGTLTELIDTEKEVFVALEFTRLISGTAAICGSILSIVTSGVLYFGGLPILSLGGLSLIVTTGISWTVFILGNLVQVFLESSFCHFSNARIAVQQATDRILPSKTDAEAELLSRSFGNTDVYIRFHPDLWEEEQSLPLTAEAPTKELPRRPLRMTFNSAYEGLTGSLKLDQQKDDALRQIKKKVEEKIGTIMTKYDPSIQFNEVDREQVMNEAVAFVLRQEHGVHGERQFSLEDFNLLEVAVPVVGTKGEGVVFLSLVFLPDLSTTEGMTAMGAFKAALFNGDVFGEANRKRSTDMAAAKMEQFLFDSHWTVLEARYLKVPISEAVAEAEKRTASLPREARQGVVVDADALDDGTSDVTPEVLYSVF